MIERLKRLQILQPFGLCVGFFSVTRLLGVPRMEATLIGALIVIAVMAGYLARDQARLAELERRVAALESEAP